jgi:hypothetical protein
MAGEDKPHDLMVVARKAAIKLTWAAEMADLKRLLDVIEKHAAEGEEPNTLRNVEIPQSQDSPPGGVLRQLISPRTLPPTLTP